MNPRRSAWISNANCIEYPAPFEKEKPSKSEYDPICSACPVRNLCRDHALANYERGIWGSTTENERKRIRESGIDLSHVPIEVNFQDQFLTSKPQDVLSKTAEQKSQLKAQKFESDLAALRERVQQNLHSSEQRALAAKESIQRLAKLRLRVQGIS